MSLFLRGSIFAIAEFLDRFFTFCVFSSFTASINSRHVSPSSLVSAYSLVTLAPLCLHPCDALPCLFLFSFLLLYAKKKQKKHVRKEYHIRFLCIQLDSSGPESN